MFCLETLHKFQSFLILTDVIYEQNKRILIYRGHRRRVDFRALCLRLCAWHCPKLPKMPKTVQNAQNRPKLLSQKYIVKIIFFD